MKTLTDKGDFRIPEEAGTRHRDYILTPYKPLCGPRGRLHSVSAYRFAMETEGCWQAAVPLLNALRAGLGHDETVWGFKYGPAGFSSELYFYSHRPNPPGNPKSAARIRKLLKPFADIRGGVPESAPYFMCSLDFTPADLKAGCFPEFKIYLGAPGNGYTGYSYLAAKGGLRLENHYSFYPMPAGLGEVRKRLVFSARAGKGAGLRGKLFPGYLADCGTICYAVKPLRDALYFSRLTTAQLERFMAENHPGAFQKMLAENRDGFAHLLWDIGYDFFRSGKKGNGPVISDKFGIYGVL